MSNNYKVIISRFHFLTIFIILLIFSFPSICFSELKQVEDETKRWVLYGKSSEGTQFYCDIKSILFVSPKVLQVWVKETLSKEMKKQYIQIRMKSGLPTNGWEKLNEVMTFQEIDCVKRTFKPIKIVFYDDKGNMLDLVTDPDPKRKEIIPDSIGEILLNGVCPRE